MTSFVDRRSELAEIQRLVSTARLVTLTGTPGVGKTRLALRAAAGLGRRLPDGAWLVELAEIRDDALVADAVAQALRVHHLVDRSPLDAVREFFRDRRALLILDGCEHLAQGCAELVGTLLRDVETARILTTSREALAVGDERVFVVAPLGLSNGAPGRNGTPVAAAHLFADRASAVSPHFALTTENAQLVNAICHRLDGLPLAIELAATRLRVLSVEHLMHRLDDRFAVLDAGHRTGARHQRTLRATVDWSFDLCTPQEQAMWARLSVFVGRFDLAAAAYVCAVDGVDPESVFGVLDGLVAKSILQVRTQAGQVRYWLLDTLRQYGAQRLRATDTQATVRRRHADWYLDLVERAEREWFGPEQISWLARMQAEWANIRAALEFHLSSGDAELGARLAGALWFYWTNSGPTNEAGYWLDRVLALDTKPSALRAKALWVAGYVAIVRNERDRAADWLAQARPMAAQFGDRLLEAWIVGRQQSMATIQGEFDRGMALGEEALRLFEEAGESDGAGAALVHTTTATIGMFRGDVGATTAASNRAQAICRAHGERWIQAFTLANLGRLAWMRGEAEQAIELTREMIRLRRGGPQPAALLPALEQMSWATEAAGQHRRAATLQGALHQLRRTFAIPVNTKVPAVYLLDPTQSCERRTRLALGERAYTNAFRRGTRIPIEDIATFALGEKAKPDQRTVGPQLTRRELQVAHLVAEGLSNREIASRLTISTRTAESHIEHLLGKLGLNSRAQIAAWVAHSLQDRPTPPTS
ncbi:MAG: LuxR family transcriptional regulator [Actinobacteria bacterium]|nr:MAG: LuxR family transcriptional regulator [Actinomycetota bacterium]